MGEMVSYETKAKFEDLRAENERLQIRIAAGEKAMEGMIEVGARADAEIKLLLAALEAIKKAAVDGRVCDDVAWFDSITTLYDYIDQVLNGNGQVVAAAHEQRESPEGIAQSKVQSGEWPP